MWRCSGHICWKSALEGARESCSWGRAELQNFPHVLGVQGRLLAWVLLLPCFPCRALEKLPALRALGPGGIHWAAGAHLAREAEPCLRHPLLTRFSTAPAGKGEIFKGPTSIFTELGEKGDKWS